MVENCFTVSAFCICAVILAVLLRQYCREQSLMISIATSVAVMSVFVGLISPALLQIEEIFTDAGISSSYISLIFKAAAICFVTQITCDLCRDSGESAISTVAELWCRGAMTVMTVPIVKAILEMIEDFL